MGLVLGMETSTGAKIPTWFSRSDSKSILYHLGTLMGNDERAELPRLLSALGVSVEPLTRIVYPEQDPLEEYVRWHLENDRTATPERARREWERGRAELEAAWQPPQVLVTCIEVLLAGLTGAESRVFEACGISDSYFLDGVFRSDLEDLLRMAAWAQDQAIPAVRLFFI